MAGRGSIREHLPDQRFDGLGTGRTDRMGDRTLNRESSSFDSDNRAIVKELRDWPGIERCRHHDDDQVGANIADGFRAASASARSECRLRS